MKKAVWFAGIIGTCFLFTGCSNFSPAVTGVSINKNGVVREVIKENFESSDYSEEELKLLIDQEVEAYNISTGVKQIKNTGLSVKNGMVNVSFTYADFGDYADFNHVDFYLGDIDGAVKNGYTFQGVFHPVVNGRVQEEDNYGSSLMSGKQEYHVLVISEPILVSVPGKITYVSDGVKVTDSAVAVSETSEIAYILYE